MRLRKFLLILGFWVAILPHLGFSISTENVLFSITGFLPILASFYLAALEDKHKNRRIIDGEILHDASQKAQTLFGHVDRIKRQTLQKITPDKKISENKTKKIEIEKIKTETKIEPPVVEEDVVVIETDDGRPRIKKAVSDVKIKTDSIDDIVS